VATSQHLPSPAAPADTGGRRSSASGLVLATLACTTILFFSDLLLEGQVPVFRDLLVFVVPFKEFLARRLRAGMIPLWNPWIALGTPFLASLQTGVFYPPSLLLLVPLPLGFDLFIVFHYLVALTGAWCWIRARDLSIGAAAVGALTFTLGGYLVSMMSVTNHLQAGCWAPWVLLAWDRYLSRRAKAGWVAFTLLVALQVLAGAPESSLMTLSLAAAATCFRLLGRWREAASAAAALGLAAVVALALTAIQIAPTVEYVRESARGQSLRPVEVMSWSMQPVSLLGLLLPHGGALGPGVHPGDLGPMLERTPPWIASLYVGLAPLCLAVVGAVFGVERWLWAPAAGLALLLALGDHLPLLPALLHAAPGVFGRFRFPEKFFFVTHLGVAVLAAAGFELLRRREPRAERLALATAFTLAIVVAALAAARILLPDLYLRAILVLGGGWQGAAALASLAESIFVRAWRALAILATFAGLLLLRRLGACSGRTMSVLVVALVGTDLAATHYGLNLAIPWAELGRRRAFVDLEELRGGSYRLFHYQTTSAAFPGQEPKPLRGLEHLSRFGWQTQSARSLFREAWQASTFNTPMLDEVGTLSGADGIQRNSENMLREALSLPFRPQAVQLLGIFSVLYLVGPEPLDVAGLRAMTVPHDFPFHVYRIENVAPQAYLAWRIHSASSDLDAFNRMIAGDFRPGKDAVISAPLGSWRDGCGDSTQAPGEVSVIERRDDQLRLRVSARCTALLVVNDSHFPGWHAALDGRGVEILRANALVRGVVVPAGGHEITFAYRPASFRIGAVVSATTLVGLALWTLAAAARARSSR
jgi:hypothetical protein